MNAQEKECGEVFLREQEKLFQEPVVSTLEEAVEFLEDCFIQVLDTPAQVRDYLEENGADVSGMDDEEIVEQLEVFKLSSGRYFVIEA